MKKILIIGLILSIGLLLIGCGGSGRDEPDEFSARIMANKFVENRLKAPSTADFASHSNSTITEISNGRFRVRSYVDAENSFGAKVRTNFTAVVEHQGGSSWELISLDM